MDAPRFDAAALADGARPRSRRRRRAGLIDSCRSALAGSGGAAARHLAEYPVHRARAAADDLVRVRPDAEAHLARHRLLLPDHPLDAGRARTSRTASSRIPGHDRGDEMGEDEAAGVSGFAAVLVLGAENRGHVRRLLRDHRGVARREKRDRLLLATEIQRLRHARDVRFDLVHRLA